jgi:hypothetical protein
MFKVAVGCYSRKTNMILSYKPFFCFEEGFPVPLTLLTTSILVVWIRIHNKMFRIHNTEHSEQNLPLDPHTAEVDQKR